MEYCMQRSVWKLTIKKKIMLSNIMMVMIPILITAAVITVCLHTSLGSYWYTLESMYTDENGIQFAQSMIYNYQQELWDFNWVSCGQEDGSGKICHSKEMAYLENKLSGLGNRFMITEDGEQVYSNMSQEDMRTGRQVAGEAMESAKVLTASRYEVSVIKNTFWHGDRAFCITAVHPHKTDNRMVNNLKNCILRNVYGILVFFIVLTVASNGILSWWISKRRRDLITGFSNTVKYRQSGHSRVLLSMKQTVEGRGY